MRKHFLHKDTAKKLIQNGGIRKGFDLAILFFRLKEMYKSSQIINKSLLDIAKTLDMDKRVFEPRFLKLEELGMITREMTSSGKRIIKLRSERTLSKDSKDIIYFNIKETEYEDILDYLIAKYTDYATREFRYLVDKKAQREKKARGGYMKNNRGKREQKLIPDCVIVTDKFLSELWAIKNIYTANRLKRKLMAKGYFRLHQVVLFLFNAPASSLNELRDTHGDNCFIKDNKAYKHTGSSFEFRDEVKLKEVKYLPYVPKIIKDGKENNKC